LLARQLSTYIGWGCGEMTCPGGYYVAGVDFNASQSEGCWGDNNNDEHPLKLRA